MPLDVTFQRVDAALYIVSHETENTSELNSSLRGGNATNFNHVITSTMKQGSCFSTILNRQVLISTFARKS